MDNSEKPDQFLHYRNLANFAVSISCLANLIWIWKYNTHHAIALPITFAHLVFDFPFATPEIKLHHFFGILIALSNYAFQVKVENSWHLFKSIYQTELSSIFYVFRYWITEDNRFLKNRFSKKSIATIKQINDLLFYVAFLKFRVYDYTKDVILNAEGFELMETHLEGRFDRRAILYSGLCGLYLLNLYWFVIMTKIAFKPLVKMAVKYLSTKQAIIYDQTFTQYSAFFQIPVVIYVYSKFANESYFFDIIGISTLSVASNHYHYLSAEYYEKHGVINYSDCNLSDAYLDDQAAIHLRAFLSLISALYYSENSGWIWISGSLHLGSVIATVRYVRKLQRTSANPTGEPTNESGSKLLQFTNLATALPIALDIAIIALHSSSNIAAIKNVTVSYLCLLALTVRPFYEFNHSVFHALLIVQSYYISQCNLRA